VTHPTDEQILITREFDAPKHLVYRARTEPGLIKRWWHAKRGQVTVVEVDPRVGGEWRYLMVAVGRRPCWCREPATRDRGEKRHQRVSRKRAGSHSQPHARTPSRQARAIPVERSRHRLFITSGGRPGFLRQPCVTRLWRDFYDAFPERDHVVRSILVTCVRRKWTERPRRQGWLISSARDPDPGLWVSR